MVNAVTSHIYPHGQPLISKKPRKKIEIPLDCGTYNLTKSCPTNYPSKFELEEDANRPLTPTCPDYFRWIHEDLKPWARTGITRDMVERARRTANFRYMLHSTSLWYSFCYFSPRCVRICYKLHRSAHYFIQIIEACPSLAINLPFRGDFLLLHGQLQLKLREEFGF